MSCLRRRFRRIHPVVAGLALIGALPAPAAGQDAIVDPEPTRANARAGDAGPMAPFARMIPGEWKMTVESGTSSFRTWHWGPGRHSMRVMTDGFDAAGNPWRDLDVFYWHPGGGQVREFGVSQFARGVTEGAITFEGETWRSDFDLFQTGGRRTLRLIWDFDGPDRYHATLQEASPGESRRYTTLVEWDLLRTSPSSPPRPLAVEGATKPSDLLRPLELLLGTWEAKMGQAIAGALHTRATLEWIPLADAIYARVLAPANHGEPAHLLDAYLYHHTGAGTLRCLALSERGGVYEGDVTVLDDGALQLGLKGYEGGQQATHVVRIDFGGDDALRTRAWSLEGDERTLRLDLHHHKAGMGSD
ncbi:MAG TPA: hypothetical protein VFF69_11055 [Phycisphaerales bacterium]|nr:hypothetical protein [Phycisphaerales bacterium]